MDRPAGTVEAYLASLPADRRAALQAVREVILANLDAGYREGMQYGMIGYCVPHSAFPAGYHCDPRQPLPFASLGSQKNHMAVYLMSVYGSPEEAARFRADWAKTGKRLDMGKSCVRFKKAGDLALDVIGRTIARMPAKKYVAAYAAALRAKGAKRKKAKVRRSGTSSRRKMAPRAPRSSSVAWSPALFERLLAHDRRANGQALASLESMRKAPRKALYLMGHVMGAEVSWLRRITKGSDPADWERWEKADLPWLRRAWRRSLPARWSAFLGDAALSDPGRTFSYVNYLGKTWEARVDDALLQLMLHSAYHRGQVASLVRAAGGEPAVVDYMHVRRTGAVRQAVRATSGRRSGPCAARGRGRTGN